MNDLKQKLDTEKYQRFADFRRCVLDIAQREITQYTDLDISYQPIKDNSRKYNKICISISTKSPAAVLQAEKEVAKTLSHTMPLSQNCT